MNEPLTNPRPAAQPSRSAPTQVVPQVPPAPRAPAPVHRESPQPLVPPAAQPAPQAAEPSGEAPYVTIVLPCYNEGQHVLQEIDRITAAMNASEFTYELLCIDDASTDDTLDRAARRGATATPTSGSCRSAATAGPARPGASAPSRRTARSWCGPTPT